MAVSHVSYPTFIRFRGSKRPYAQNIAAPNQTSVNLNLSPRSRPLALIPLGGMEVVENIIADGMCRVIDVHVGEEMKDSATLAKQRMRHVVHVARKLLDQLSKGNQIPFLKIICHPLHQILPRRYYLDQNQARATQLSETLPTG